MSPTSSAEEPLVDSEAFLRALEDAGVRYAILGTWQDVVSDGRAVLRLLVAREDVAAARRFLGHTDPDGSSGGEQADSSRSVDASAKARAPAPVTLLTELRYGMPVPCLTTGEPESRILRRASVVGGARTVAPGDELIDLLLHCVVDLRAFPDAHRLRLCSLVAALRSDVLAAGRAAERVQHELAPALEWGDLLAELVERRWDHLLLRRRALVVHLLRRAPAPTAWRFATGRLSAPAPPRARGGTPVTPGSDDAGPPPAEHDADGSAGAEPDASRAERIEPAPAVAGEAPSGGRPQLKKADSDALSRKQIRGSGLLLFGRGLTGLKFLAELVVIRYLSTSAYGSWTYALAAVVFLRGLATLGLNRAVVRFAPIHLERGERQDFLGVLGFVLGSLTLACSAVVIAFYALPESVAAIAGVADRQPIDLMFIVIFLVPVEAIDDYLTAVCAAFTDSRTIFVRRYLLNPGLRLAVALALVVFQAEVAFLAYGYLFAGLAGIAYYTWSVLVALRRRGLIDLGLLRRVRLPVRRVLSYTVPVMTADWCTILMTTSGPLLLGYFSDMSAVALFRVVIPLVTLNQIVAQTFGVLFEPVASRLYARRDRPGLNQLYWRSAVWVAVLSFPAFAVSFTAAEPLTVFLYGARYESAAPILSLLAVGAFFESIVGFNASTLRAAGQLRWLVGTNVVAALGNVALHVILIPRWGALGAGIATGTSWVAFALFKQVGMRLGTGVRAFDMRYAGPYLTIAVASLFLVAVRLAWPDSALVLLGAAAAASLVVLLQARATLSITDTFPELGRFRLLKAVLG